MDIDKQIEDLEIELKYLKLLKEKNLHVNPVYKSLIRGNEYFNISEDIKITSFDIIRELLPDAPYPIFKVDTPIFTIDKKTYQLVNDIGNSRVIEIENFEFDITSSIENIFNDWLIDDEYKCAYIYDVYILNHKFIIRGTKI